VYLEEFKDLKDGKLRSTCSSFYDNAGTKKFASDGFESYRVPRTSSAFNLEGRSTKRYEKQIAQSVSYANKGQTANDVITQSVNQNENLANIFNKQSSKQYLNVSRLPRIALIVNQPKLIAKKTGIGNSKIMGEKFNPYNFQTGDQKNWTGRNLYGALFQH